jgi:hypothetical protein
MPSPELAEYFAAERQGGFLLVALSLVGFGFAGFLWLTRNAFAAMAWPLVLLGALQLIVGLAVALRTPAQVAALEQGMATAAAATATAETERMNRVNRNFRIVKAGEIALIVVGLSLAILLPHPGTWAAVGLGLLVEGSALLAFDAFAHQRALVYTQWLRQFG